MKCNGYKVISSLKALPHMVQGGFLSDLRRFMAIPHNSKCRYGERGAASAGAVLKPQGGNCAVLP